MSRSPEPRLPVFVLGIPPTDEWAKQLLTLHLAVEFRKVRASAKTRITVGGLLAAGLLSVPSFGQCLPFTEAHAHTGTSKCITGKVLKVTRTASGTTFLNFCADYRTCPFQVVVFAGDLRHVGDVRQLEGKVIEISGDIKEYDGHAEILLSRLSQLRGDAARIPPLPKNYDVERKGHYSAGKLKYPKASKKTPRKRQSAPIPTEEPENPAPNE
jgi:hypothetical protein